MTTKEELEYIKDFANLVKFMNEKLEKEGISQVNLTTYNEVVDSIEAKLLPKLESENPKPKTKTKVEDEKGA